MTKVVEQGIAHRPRLEARDLSAALENFTRHLADLGHTPLTVSGYEAGDPQLAKRCVFGVL
jgi:hypothetical protein